MEFSKAQFEALVEEVTAGIDEISRLLGQIEPAAQAGVNRLGMQYLLPQEVVEAMLWIARRSRELGQGLLQLIIDCVQGMTAPIFMFMDSLQWSDIRGQATDIAQALSAQSLVIDNSAWNGTAHSAYVDAAASQSDAASKISSIAATTSNTLMVAAGTGAAFYVEVAYVITKFIAAICATIVAFETAVFSWAGVLLTIEEASFSSAAIWGGVGILTAFLGAQASTFITMHGEATDGSWPDAKTSGFSDGTVGDGNANWSLA